MNGLQVFNYHDKQVRTVQQDGEPWWVLADVCKALELKSPHKVAERLDDDEKGRTFFPTLGGKQEITIVNEPGLYSVILRSSKPEAKAFKRWVTHEVLPSIRKTGAYGPQGDPRIAALEETVGKLAELMGSLVQQRQGALQPSNPSTEKAIVPGKAARRRWMRTLNEKLDVLEANSGLERWQVLQAFYRFVEQACGIILDEERVKRVEKLGIEDCSVLEVIFNNERLRKNFERHIDANLPPQEKGW